MLLDYGFVVRYLKGKEKETGYMAEEWHLRWVSEKKAKEIAETGLSLKNTYGFEGGDMLINTLKISNHANVACCIRTAWLVS